MELGLSLGGSCGGEGVLVLVLICEQGVENCRGWRTNTADAAVFGWGRSLWHVFYAQDSKNDIDGTYGSRHCSPDRVNRTNGASNIDNNQLHTSTTLTAYSELGF